MIKVPENVVKTQVDIMLLTFIKNRTLKIILFHIFQFVWTQVLKNLNFNILIPTISYNGALGEFIKNLLPNNTIRVELTEVEAIKGKAVRLKIHDKDKVLIVNIPRGTQKDQSFYLFYLIKEDNNSASFKA